MLLKDTLELRWMDSDRVHSALVERGGYQLHGPAPDDLVFYDWLIDAVGQPAGIEFLGKIKALATD